MDYKFKTKEDNNMWLMQGDCLERMKEIPDGSVDMILTDPPY
jgi:DNA modification methylase